MEPTRVGCYWILNPQAWAETLALRFSPVGMATLKSTECLK
jgi:hypothetical protein